MNVLVFMYVLYFVFVYVCLILCISAYVFFARRVAFRSFVFVSLFCVSVLSVFLIVCVLSVLNLLCVLFCIVWMDVSVFVSVCVVVLLFGGGVMLCVFVCVECVVWLFVDGVYCVVCESDGCDGVCVLSVSVSVIVVECGWMMVNGWLRSWIEAGRSGRARDATTKRGRRGWMIEMEMEKEWWLNVSEMMLRVVGCG